MGEVTNRKIVQGYRRTEKHRVWKSNHITLWMLMQSSNYSKQIRQSILRNEKVGLESGAF